MSIDAERHFGGTNDRISIDALPYGYIANIHQRFEEKVYSPARDGLALHRLSALRQSWADGESITVFTSGVFDMLHLDHAGYLLHTKAVGAAEHYKRYDTCDTGWHDLTTLQQQQYTSELLGSGQLKLIVSIDGDRSVAIRKGNNPDKGNATRPVYAWRTRALQVASQCYIDPTDETQTKILPIVDAVTIHGEHDFKPDHNHASIYSLAEKLAPDVWAVFGESKDILDEAPTRNKLGEVALRCIMDGKGTHYFEDDVIGKMSTTSIVRRVRGEA